MAMLAKNVFLDIVEKKIPANIVYEDDAVLAFADLHPQAPTHLLFIPKKEIRTHLDVQPEDGALLGKLHLAVVKVAQQLKLSSYRLIINCNEGAGQTVPHLHMHLLAGRTLAWPPG